MACIALARENDIELTFDTKKPYAWLKQGIVNVLNENIFQLTLLNIFQLILLLFSKY